MVQQFPSDADRILVSRDGSWAVTAAMPTLILPGSFNPVHEGHWKLAAVAEEMLQQSAAFEISLTNVDKPDLTFEEAERRVKQFAGRADVWLTRAPRFVEKASLFPGATFVLGADTALRLVDGRYYANDAERMETALGEMVERECRFLVAARIDSTGRCQTLADIPLPVRFADYFRAIPVERFRLDISSTQLRAVLQETPASLID